MVVILCSRFVRYHIKCYIGRDCAMESELHVTKLSLRASIQSSHFHR